LSAGDTLLKLGLDKSCVPLPCLEGINNSRVAAEVAHNAGQGCKIFFVHGTKTGKMLQINTKM
jgi:hypothetical protein